MKDKILIPAIIGAIIAFFIIANYDPQTIVDTLNDNGFSALNGDLISEDLIRSEFDTFISIHRRSYQNDLEYDRRYTIFRDNYLKIQEHNKNSHISGYTLGMNKFGDLTLKEFSDSFLGYKGNNSKTHPSPKSYNNRELFLNEGATTQAIRQLKIPARIDWRETGAVTPVQDQGNCSASWAFSAIAAVEGINRISQKSSEKLSEQQLIDCSSDNGNKGCNGGNITNAFDYIKTDDLCTQSYYPYTGTKDFCKEWLYCHTSFMIKSYQSIPQRSKLAIYTALSQQPISVAVDANSTAWQFYQSGIMNLGCDQDVNHALTAVGYDTESYLYFWDTAFVTLKNSLGKGWGMDGYVKLAANKEDGDGTSCLFTNGFYPVL